jgi:hypothetical protein
MVGDKFRVRVGVRVGGSRDVVGCVVGAGISIRVIVIYKVILG